MYREFRSGWGSKADFKNYVAMMHSLSVRLPLGIASHYYQTIFHLFRWRLLHKSPLAYPGVFADMKNIKEGLANRLEGELQTAKSCPMVIPPLPRVERVLIFYPYVVADGSSTAVMAMFFNKIREFWPNAKFHMLVSDEFYFYGEDGPMLHDLLQGDPENISYSDHSLSARPRIEKVLADEHISGPIKFTDAQKGYKARAMEAVNWGTQVNPDLFVTSTLDSIVDIVFSRRYPTIRLSPGDMEPVATSVADINITPQEVKYLEPVLRDNGLEAETKTYRHFLYPVRPLALKKNSPAGDLFNLPESFFYIPSISRQFETGIFEDIRKEVFAFLDRHENARWILAGVKEVFGLPSELDHEKIIKIYIRPDAIELLSIIDVLVPVTLGTGITVLTAMKEGVPVLSVAKRPSPYTHSLHLMPTDASIMVGSDRALPDAKTLGERLEKLYLDREYADEYKASMRIRADRHFMDRLTSTREQSACIGEVFDQYKRRTSFQHNESPTDKASMSPSRNVSSR